VPRLKADTDEVVGGIADVDIAESGNFLVLGGLRKICRKILRLNLFYQYRNPLYRDRNAPEAQVNEKRVKGCRSPQ